MMYAAVVSRYGPPSVLEWKKVATPEPGAGQIRIRVEATGVGPTDLRIRSGSLADVFRLPEPIILGFETAGTVDALGPGVNGVVVGDEVAALLPNVGGYAEYAIASRWVKKPAAVSWAAAGALPASAEAAIGVLGQLEVKAGETLVVLGAAGSVGLIAVQMAKRRGARVIGVAADRSRELVESLGAAFLSTRVALTSGVLEMSNGVDAVFDAAGAGQLPAAIDLTGTRDRVITLSDATAPGLGVRLSAPTPDRAPEALDVAMALLADGHLVLKEPETVPLRHAAQVHTRMEAAGPHPKFLLMAD